MCEVVVDFGNEIEMRALYTRQQRALIPTLRILSLLLAIASGLVSLLRYAERKQPVEHMDLLCATASLILLGGAEYESRKSFRKWMEGMPKVQRIALD
jgi:hypothetical protein